MDHVQKHNICIMKVPDWSKSLKLHLKLILGMLVHCTTTEIYEFSFYKSSTNIKMLYCCSTNIKY
jgi:hypothetical protein